MRVETIRQVTKKRSSICVEGQPAVVLYNGELSRYRIREDSEISESVWEEILLLLTRRAKKRALNLLLRADKTRKQLLEKLLSDGYPEEIAEQAVSYAESFGYIDDERYAERYLDGPGSKKSRMAARMELLRKGICAETIEKVVEAREDSSEEEEREKVRRMAWKRLNDAVCPDEKEYRRVYGYLARRGFSSADILAVLEEYRRTFR